MMKYKQIIKFLLVLFTVATIGLFHTVDASDYKYKVSDPRYNNAAVQFEPRQQQDADPREMNINLKVLFILFLLSVATYYGMSKIKISEKSKENLKENIEKVKEIAIEKAIKTAEVTADVLKKQAEIYKASKSLEETLVEKPLEQQPPENNKEKTEPVSPILPEPIATAEAKVPSNTKTSLKKYFSTPIIKSNRPTLLNAVQFSKNKGLCLVTYKNKTALTGYINKDIFVLAKFSDMDNIELRSRLSETIDGKERYIIKLGRSYKALVEVSDQNMELLLEL